MKLRIILSEKILSHRSLQKPVLQIVAVAAAPLLMLSWSPETVTHTAVRSKRPEFIEASLDHVIRKYRSQFSRGQS